MNKQLKKFLNNRATISPWSIVGTDRNDFAAAVIIPALAEMESLPQTLASLAKNPAEYLQKTLILVVVNNRTDSSADQKENNRKTLEWLKSQPYPQLNLALVDASSPSVELPPKEGVGLARKIGFDLALQFMDWSQSPFFISLDADTLVDKNYLPAIFKSFRKTVQGGVVLPFRHQFGETREQEAAIRDYELYLRSYLFGLQQAGSPYAYHAIGSAFACRAEAYIAAGGMNRRHAAEDFYFLQQLAKVSGIEMLRGTVVHPSPRISTRVPFGTGKAVQSQIEKERQIYSFISADSFQLLKTLFGLIARHLDSSAETVLNAATALSPVLRHFLDELGFSQVWVRLQRNHTRDSQRLRAFHHWFDALRTRQLLMRVENDHSRSTETIVAELLHWGGAPALVEKNEQLGFLENLQGVV